MMFHCRWLKIIIALPLLFALSGCWSKKELNDLAITMGMAIDTAPNGRYKVTIQVVDAGEVSAAKGSLGRSPVVLYSGKGRTISEALQRMSTTSPRTIYNAHLRVLVIGEKLARQGIGSVMDYISRDRQFRTDFPVIIAKNNEAGDMLQILTPLESIPAMQMLGSLENSEKHWAPTVMVDFDDLIQSMTSSGIQSVVTGIVMIGSAEAGGNRSNLTTTMPENRLKYYGLSVFRKDRLIGWLSETESRGFNLALGNATKATGNVTCPDGKLIAAEVQQMESKLIAKPIGDKLMLGIKLKIESNVSEVACQIKLTQDAAIAQLEKSAEKKIEKIIKLALNRAQKELKVDIFGFGVVLHRHHPAYWKMVEDRWDETFAKTPVTLDIDVKIRQIGTVSEPLQYQ